MAAPRLLLLQARRKGDRARGEELESFAHRAGVEPEQLISHDLLAGAPTLSEARAHDGVLIGGAGDFYVSKRDLPSHHAFMDFLVDLTESGLSVFASCFGYQYLVEALNGQIVHDPGNMEVGTYDLKLTDEGSSDPVFSVLPRTFRAQLGRKDRATLHPEGVPNLASSERCPFQALRVPNRPVWASQFHPELDGETNRRRYMNYLDGYSGSLSEEDRRLALDRFSESPDTLGLLRRFIEVVF